jgi:hypothetical protein
MKRRTFTAGAGAAALLGLSRARAAAGGKTVTVEAGERERKNTPVSFELGAELARRAGRRYELRDAKNQPVPLQVEANGRAFFVVRALGKSEKATYTLRAGGRAVKSAADLAVKREADGVVFNAGAAPVLRFATTGKLPAGIDPKFLRGGYIHPIYSPAGVVVSDDYPPDHKHHHGVWSAWTKTEYEGRHPDFWNMGDKTGKVDFAALGEVWAGPLAAGLSARNAVTDLSATPPKAVIDQDWKIALYRTHDEAPPYHLFDVEWTDTLLGTAPLKLPEYRYGGLGIRGARAWKDKALVSFLTSEGKDRAAADSTTGRWFHMGGTIDGKVAGLAVLGHPGNFRAPQPLRINPSDPFVCWAPPKAGAFALDPGKPYVSRYRFVVADGAVDKELIDRLYADYADPPRVTFTG